MCGITGVAHVGATRRTDDRGLVESMCQALLLRGPDGGGVDSHPEATLGVRRLAIVDLEHGEQPMRSDDGLVTLVYNGEIYNAPALRQRLAARGVAFRTRSDTEVLLRLYEDDPDDVERHLCGMWAFAVLDRRRSRLLLSRDRFGIKPLFVADVGSEIAFASDLRCFAPLRERLEFRNAFRVDRSAAHAMLSWAYVPELATIFEGVVRLSPGSRLEIDLVSGARASRSTWRAVPSIDAERAVTLDEASELVDAALRRSAREHLESDVPIAAFLSGGIDSALVAAYAQEAAGTKMTAYSVGFLDTDFDESRHAASVAGLLGMRSVVEVVDDELMRRSLADALLAYDEPFGDSSSLAAFVLSRRVARDYKVVLGGDGGDEAFAGYRKHGIVALRGVVAPHEGLRQRAARLLTLLPHRAERTPRSSDWLRTAQRLASGLQAGDAGAYTALTQVASLVRTAPLMSSTTGAQRFWHESVARYETLSGTPLRRTLQADLGGVLPNDMLTKIDRASKACSLEVRVPLLDHRVVEIGLGLPSRFTAGGLLHRRGGGKVVLRELFRRKFGSRLAYRRKQGLRVPLERWFRGWLSGPCDRLFERRRLERDGLLSVEALSRGRWRAWAQREPQVVWHAFALAAWCEATLGGGPDALREVLEPDASR